MMSSAGASHSSSPQCEVSKFHFPIKEYAELAGYMADSRCGAGNVQDEREHFIPESKKLGATTRIMSKGSKPT